LQETLTSSGSGYEVGKFYNSSYLDKANAFKRGPSLNMCCSEKSPKHYHRPGENQIFFIIAESRRQ